MVIIGHLVCHFILVHPCTILIMHTCIRKLPFISILFMEYIWCVWLFENDHMTNCKHLTMIIYLFMGFKHGYKYCHACIKKVIFSCILIRNQTSGNSSGEQNMNICIAIFLPSYPMSLEIKRVYSSPHTSLRPDSMPAHPNVVKLEVAPPARHGQKLTFPASGYSTTWCLGCRL